MDSLFLKEVQMVKEHAMILGKIELNGVLVAIIALALHFLGGISVSAQRPEGRDFLRQLKAKEVQWGPESCGDQAMVRPRGSKRWGLFVLDYGENQVFGIDTLLPPAYDSIGFFCDLDRFVFVKKDGKYGLFLLPSEVHDAAERIDCRFDALQHILEDGEDYVKAKQGKGWGLLDWFTQTWLIEPVYAQAEEVPLVYFDSWMQSILPEIKSGVDADLVFFDGGNGDGVFKARHKVTGKWGMFQYGGTEIQTLIPMEYDSLRFFPFNGMYTAVYKGGNVGIYLSYWSYGADAHQTLPCAYEDYKRFSADGVSKLAMKKNGKWGWVDWLHGTEKSEFRYETTDDLPYPYFKQE